MNGSLAHQVAYFSMEIALDPSIPTYAGGLGILAGDTLRAAADLDVPMVAVTLVHRRGYFRQELTPEGQQRAVPLEWQPEQKLELMKPTVTVRVEGRAVLVRAWRFVISGCGGDVVPVYLLDTDVEGNAAEDRRLTDTLYGGDSRYRLCQEAILGIGGVEILPKLGHAHISSYHLNEGHAALLALALVEQQLGGRSLEQVTMDDARAVHAKCVFTTHTPVPAGHDQFPIALVRQVLGDARTVALERTKAYAGQQLNMTYLGMYASRYINGVAMQHGEVSRGMFPDYPVRAITNGVHAATWTTKPFADLFDRHIPEWRRDNLYLRYAVGIARREIQDAHAEAKRALIAEVDRRTGTKLQESAFTIGFARRSALYKRASLIFSDLDRILNIDKVVGPIQFVFGGKAHPQDEDGKAMIARVFEAKRRLGDTAPVAFLPDFDWAVAPLVYAGVDLWLNTPKRPQEASGTSGMKAALNGVPSLSVLDGWWLEGCFEGVTGWPIGHSEVAETEEMEVASLYQKLEQVILPMYFGRPTAYAEVMRSAIAINGSFFNTQRMVSQYVANAYVLPP
ncbi:MAG: alpha-glucan family phosphorylase [Bryobacteraceae bacterium]